MKKRKLLAGLFVATAALGLAACTDTETPVEPEPTPEVVKYTVTFNVDGGSAVASITVDANGKITLPTAPTKADHTFGGWFTDSACTKAFDASTAITANTTLYAKWTAVEKDPDADKVKIADAEDFIAMLKGEFEEVAVGSGLVEHYILTADIDFADIDLGAELGTTAYSFSGILDGRGHTISNLKMIRHKKQVGLFEGIYAGTIKNLNFKDVEISNAPQDAEGNVDTSDCRGVSLFGNYAAGGASFENIAIDGFKVYTNADSTKVEESAGLVVNLFDTVYVENLAITGMDVTLGKNSGAVLGAMRVTTDTLKVAGVEVTNKTACVIEAKNILLEGNIKGTTSDSQGLGGFIGRCDNAEDGQIVNVDGFVFKGTITGTKNNGPLIGNVKKEQTVVNVKNAYVLDGGIVADGTLQGTANVFAGQFKAEEYTFENCFYVDRLYNTKKEKDGKISTLGYLDPEIAAPITAASITAITDAFTVADGKITLNGLSVEIPTDVTVVENAASTITVNGATPTITDGVITITGKIPYWHAASAAGAAGNFVEVKLVAAEGVTTTDSFYVLDTTCSYENAAEMSIYVPVAPLAEGVEAYTDSKITVRWNNAAKDEVYTVKFANDITFEDAPVYGAISQDVAGLTAANPVTGEGDAAVTDSYTLKYTAGTIAWDTDGNYVTVKVAQPTWAEGLNTPTVTNATLVSCENGVATIKVKVAAAGSNFKVQWSATTDAQTYALAFDEAVVFGESTADTSTVSYSSAAQTPGWTLSQVTGSGTCKLSPTAGVCHDSGATGYDENAMIDVKKLSETATGTAPTDYLLSSNIETKKAVVNLLVGSTSTGNQIPIIVEGLDADGNVVATATAYMPKSKYTNYATTEAVATGGDKDIILTSTTVITNVKVYLGDDNSSSTRHFGIVACDITYEKLETAPAVVEQDLSTFISELTEAVTYSAETKIGNSIFTALASSKANASANFDYTHRFQTGGKITVSNGAVTAKALKVDLVAPCTITIKFRTGSDGNERDCSIYSSTGELLKTLATSSTNKELTVVTYDYTGAAGSIYIGSSVNGIDLFEVSVKKAA